MVGNALALRPDVEVVESPPEPFAGIKTQVLYNTHPLARLMFFMAGNIEVGLNANSVSAPKKHFVAVRFIWSTLAYHVALEKIKFEILEPYINLWANGGQLEHLLPSKVVFLDVAREEQIRRLHGRGDYESQGELVSSDSFDSFFKRLDEAYATILSLLSVPLEVIDTTGHSPEYVLNRVSDLIP